MQVFFQTREAARKASFGKFIDNGAEAPKGQRFGRKVPGIGGNSAQRRKALKAFLRKMES